MATRSAKIDQKADLIWAIADKLTGVYKPHEYGDVLVTIRKMPGGIILHRCSWMESSMQSIG